MNALRICVLSSKCNLADYSPFTQMILSSSAKTDIKTRKKITNFYTLDFSLLMESDVLCACFLNFSF